jgi:hypothetical protein
MVLKLAWFCPQGTFMWQCMKMVCFSHLGKGVWGSLRHVVSRDQGLIKHPTKHRPAPATKNELPQNINRM